MRSFQSRFRQIATSDRKIVQMTSSTTVPFLASFSPCSHGVSSCVHALEPFGFFQNSSAAQLSIAVQRPATCEQLEQIQLVLTHVNDLGQGIPSIPLDTTNGL